MGRNDKQESDKDLEAWKLNIYNKFDGGPINMVRIRLGF